MSLCLYVSVLCECMSAHILYVLFVVVVVFIFITIGFHYYFRFLCESSYVRECVCTCGMAARVLARVLTALCVCVRYVVCPRACHLSVRMCARERCVCVCVCVCVLCCVMIAHIV